MPGTNRLDSSIALYGEPQRLRGRSSEIAPTLEPDLDNASVGKTIELINNQ